VADPAQTSWKPNARGAWRLRTSGRWEGPFRVQDGYFKQSLLGAFVPRDQVLQHNADDVGSHLVGAPFDLVNIVAAPASGTTTILIGAGAAVALGAVPPGYRAGVFGIWPYLEGAGGAQMVQGRIPGAGVTIRWRLLIDGQPAFPYHNITTILNPWGATAAERPLLEIPQRKTLSVDVLNTDPGGLYAWLGVRLVVRWIPWKEEWR